MPLVELKNKKIINSDFVIRGGVEVTTEKVKKNKVEERIYLYLILNNPVIDGTGLGAVGYENENVFFLYNTTEEAYEDLKKIVNKE